MIFTGLHSSQLKITNTSPEGLIAFHSFLKFIEDGELEETGTASQNARYAQSGISDRICAALEEKGYHCQTHVGHSDFQIDIAVIDPYHPSQYLLGIMLDGEQYNRTRNTRDREVSQSNVLARLGWKLTRVWSIDWWDDANRQINRLLEMLEPLKEAARIRREEEDARQADKAKIEEEQARLREELEQQASEMLHEQEAAEEAKPFESPVAIAPDEVVMSDDTQKTDEATTDAADDNTDIQPQVTNPEPENAAAQAGREDLNPDGAGGTSDSPVSEPESHTPAPAEEDATDDPGTQPYEPSDPTVMPDDARFDVAARKAGDPPAIHEKKEVNIEVVPYEFASLPLTKMTPVLFASPANRQELIRHVEMLLAAEAPIQKDRLIRLLVASFGVTKSSITVEATEKALKAVKVKNIKGNGNVFCWAYGQDPATYRLVRENSARLSDELPPHEIRNAICLVLQLKGSMTRDNLIFEVSRLLGYKRLGKNLEATIANGLQFAKKNDDVAVRGEQVSLKDAMSDDSSTAEKTIAMQPVMNSQPTTTGPHAKMDGPKQVILTLVSKSISAKGFITSDGFIVLKGSQMRKETRSSCRDLILKRREELITNGKVVDYIFVEDVPFSSPSAAAGVILGGDSNGLVCWANDAGILLKQLI